MKKINKILIAVVITMGGLFYSCETLELENVNDPNVLTPNLADANLLLNNIQLSYVGSMATFNNLGGGLSRVDYMFGRNYYNNYGPGTLDGPWGSLYSSIIPDIAAIQEIDDANGGKSFHLGVAKALQAHLMMCLVDYLGDVPYSQAFNAAEYPKPTVDDDQEVYNAALALLDEASALLNGATASGANDLFYRGNVSKWVKFINTVKMRANLTTKNYNAVVNATNVIETSSDDFQFAYGKNELSPDNRHPDYATDYRSDGANNYQSNWLMDIMAGDSDDWHDLEGAYLTEDDLPGAPASSDPRRRYYFLRQTFDTPGNFSLYYYVLGNGQIRVRNWPVYFGDDNTNGETLQCSLQDVPVHLQFTPDEPIWCSVKLGYWGRMHGNNEGTPPDGFTRTAAGVYPAGGSFDNQKDIPSIGLVATLGDVYAGIDALQTNKNKTNGVVGLGKGGGGAGIEPIYLSSYVEFMRAEAYLALNDATNAKKHFEAGITESITKVMSFGALDANANSALMPDQETVDTFIANQVSAFDSAPASSGLDGTGFPVVKDKMDLLGEQYFIAMFGGANDAYNFIRRTGYPRTISRNIEPNPGPFPRTLLYPSSEIISNQNILQRTNNNTQVFWDSGVTNPAN